MSRRRFIAVLIAGCTAVLIASVVRSAGFVAQSPPSDASPAWMELCRCVGMRFDSKRCRGHIDLIDQCVTGAVYAVSKMRTHPATAIPGHNQVAHQACRVAQWRMR
jgi:hypothetical protein